jgi:hypothetical protein
MLARAMQSKPRMKLPWIAFLVFACAGQDKPIRPDDMGAEAHRRAARAEQAAAREHLRCWDEADRKPTIYAVPTDQNVYLDSIFWFDPRSHELEEAERHAARARAHDEAARLLETFETEQCTGVPDYARESCHLLGPVAEIRDIEGGLFLRFADGVDTQAIAAHLRCHYAWARKQGWDHAGGCPLDIAGVRFQVVGPAILALSEDPRTVAEIRRRARLQVAPASRRN